MVQTRIFTAKDVCASLGGISRSRVHAWAQLPPFGERSTRERSARRFSKADLLTMAILALLEERFALRGKPLSEISAGVHRYVQTPRPSGKEEWVFICLDSGETRPLHAEPITEAGWVVDIAAARERIDTYLGVVPVQQELPLIADINRGVR